MRLPAVRVFRFRVVILLLWVTLFPRWYCWSMVLFSCLAIVVLLLHLFSFSWQTLWPLPLASAGLECSMMTVVSIKLFMTRQTLKLQTTRKSEISEPQATTVRRETLNLIPRRKAQTQNPNTLNPSPQEPQP